MKKLLLLAALAAVAAACGPKYETVKGDPLDAKIYTLKNGLTVYMTVNKDEPRIQTYMPVRAGGKDDPADNTGLAHYLVPHPDGPAGPPGPVPPDRLHQLRGVQDRHPERV